MPCDRCHIRSVLLTYAQNFSLVVEANGLHRAGTTVANTDELMRELSSSHGVRSDVPEHVRLRVICT